MNKSGVQTKGLLVSAATGIGSNTASVGEASLTTGLFGVSDGRKLNEKDDMKAPGACNNKSGNRDGRVEVI